MSFRNKPITNIRVLYEWIANGAGTVINKVLVTPVISAIYKDTAKTKLMTLPDTASDTLAAIAATQTLTNKTLTTPIIASIYQDAGKTKLMTLPDTASDTLVGVAATQTLTNKTLTNPIVDNICIKGSRFQVTYHDVAAADVAKTFFIAPVGCKIISAYERHVTVAGQAGTLQIEKLNTGEAPGAGDVLLAEAFDLTSTANTPVSKAAVTSSAATLVAGDALCLKLASGAATSYALGTITVTMEWT